MSAADNLASSSHQIVKLMRMCAKIARSHELVSLADTLERAASAHDLTLQYFLSAPPDESMPRDESFLDTLIDAIRQPGMMPTRLQILWILSMSRRARKLIRAYLASVEITEPAEKVVEGQRWLDEIDAGPPLDPAQKK